MADKTFLMAIDQGTTGSTVLVLDATQAQAPTVIGRASAEFPQHYPKPGWVEHDPEEIWLSIKNATEQALALAAHHDKAFKPERLAAIGITNQRETLVTFEPKTSRSLHPAIVWQCRRSTAICERLRNNGDDKTLREHTGLVTDPYFSGTKMTWLMENRPEVASAIRQGKARWGTIDTYVVHRLTSGEVFATEASNASRTLAFDLHKGAFDKDLAAILGVPHLDMLPEVKDSAGIFGRTRGVSFLPDGIPITGILGDQQAAMAGQTCFTIGEAKCTYGTGAFLLLNIGDKPKLSQASLLTTVAWSLAGKLTYALEGSAFIAGAAVQFLRDQLKIIPEARVTEALAKGEEAAPDVYFVPALTGLGAPYWDPKARGAFMGLTRGTTNGQIVRATLEGIAFQVSDLVTAMAADVPRLTVLRVDGGASANNLLMQMQADFTRLPVDRPKNLETTALGAALFAGLGVGLYKDLSEIRSVRNVDQVFNPKEEESRSQAKLKGWQRAVRAVKVFADHDA